MPLQRLSYKPLYLLLADHLEGLIREGAFPSGSFLPPVRTLMRMFSVSLATVRGACGVLESRGMIRRIHGAGIEVTYREKEEGAAASPVPVLDVTREIADLFDLRLILEPAALEAGFDAMDREKLENALAACRPTSREDVYALDRLLHEQIVSSCPNRHLARVLGDVMNRIELYRELKFRSIDLHAVLGAECIIATVEAAAARDVKRARRMLALHIRETRDVLLARMEGPPGGNTRKNLCAEENRS